MAPGGAKGGGNIDFAGAALYNRGEKEAAHKM